LLSISLITTKINMKKIKAVVLCLLTLTMLVSPVLAINPTNLAEKTEETSATEPSGAVLKQSLSEFNSLSKKERKLRFKEVKAAMKDFKAQKKAGAEPSTNTLLLVILAILLPPLAVYLHEGTTNNKFWISLILTLLFWIPGVIYALIVVLGNS
jgi:uncharacterized membrane protein YqaE (UPF0057 family)